jgi:hypothetical protein
LNYILSSHALARHVTYTGLDARSIIISGSRIYKDVSYSGAAKGEKNNGNYSGTWNVKLLREIDGGTRTYSGKWRGRGNYSDMCKMETCK